MSKVKKSVVWALFLALLPGLIACNGGGGGGGGGTASGGSSTASALTVASKVSVVDAQQAGSVGGGAAPIKLGLARLAGVLSSTPAATSDYTSDKTNVWVEDRTTESFNTINDILCMMGQTKYDSMLNKGIYTALVDQNVCSSSKSDVSSAGSEAQNQSSGAGMPSYMTFNVISSRVDNASPEILKMWIHQPASDHDSEALIYAYATIAEGSGSTNPYGIFAMHFAGYNIVNGTVAGTPSFKGTLRAVRAVASDPASKVLLQFVSQDSHDCGMGMENSDQQVILDRSADGSGGAGVIYQSSTGACGSQEIHFDIAFSAADFWRRDLITLGNPTACLDRVHFDESSWSYGLYDAAGTRLTRNSGFPITFAQGGRGFIGYWGLWADNGITINNGDIVNKVDYNNGASTPTPYTVFKAAGKLKKHTRKAMTVADITGIPLGYYEQPVTGGPGTNYQVVWGDPSNTGTTTFYKISSLPQNCSGNCTWADMAPVAVDFQHLQWGTLNFWSQSLSGSAQVPLNGCTHTAPGGQYPNGYTSCAVPVGGTSVIFYAEDVVSPGDTVPATLACYDNCPDPATITTNAPYFTSNGAEHDYTMSTNLAGSNPMLLMLGASSAGTSVTDAAYPYGLQSGALFDPSVSNLAALACPWNPGQMCTWMAWSALTEFYTWETGPSTWNQFITVTDATHQNGVKFDAPLEVKYVLNGTTYLLQYGGFGQLQGIPGKCVDMDSGLNADCSLGGSGNNAIRWVPQFTIPRVKQDGVTLTTVTDPNNVPYFVKPLEVEQRMKTDATPGACTALAGTDFAAYTPLPDMTIFVDPKVTNGDEPATPAAPAVIGGVVQ